MDMTRPQRTMTAWMLYASVLFSLFVCGIHHGQMGGLALSGLDGGYCATDSEHAHGFTTDSSESPQPVMVQFDCPLCSASGLAIAVNTASWNLDAMPAKGLAPITVRSRAQPPPRYLWPSLNPRASPASLNPVA